MSKNKIFIPIFFSLMLIGISLSFTYEWGFYGHRLINRMAVYCLPQEMINLFKANIDYISEHAVDPDKRRYATEFEAIRHYIDIDHWGSYPFDNVPRNYLDAVTKFGAFYRVVGNDSILLDAPISEETKAFQSRRNFIKNNWMPQRFEEQYYFACDSIQKYFVEIENCSEFYFKDEFSPYGIIPYYLPQHQSRLTDAFFEKNEELIIRLATDMGHYIGDAHVPLHTTENYNGQLSNQDGIHAFWESRLPELFAESSYDFIVGQAEYIENKNEYFWGIVLDSHSYLEDVLSIEKELKESYPSDMQYCYDERLGSTTRIQCEEYAAEYHKRLNGMVEDRMRASIKSIADCWYTAWVDAGQPRFEKKSIIAKIDAQIENAFKRGKILGRVH